jgi:glycosyltransferase involved in cell wall biosynthesis
MARVARDLGCEVVIVTRVRNDRARIEREGFRLIALESERKSLSPLGLVTTVMRLARIIRAEAPAVIHCISLRQAVLGGMAARLAGSRALVLAPVGLGHLWVSQRVAARAGRAVTRRVLQRLAASPDTHFLWENADDPRDLGLDPDGPRMNFVGGAGVAEGSLRPTPQPPEPPIKVAVVARMIAPKGIREAVGAVRRARALGAPVELHLFGEPDASNRDTISAGELQAFGSEPGMTWHGHVQDIAAVWREHHVAMLLSWYREGVPKSLIEAAAAGRPIITTDMAGCRDLVRDGVEGLLAPPHDIEAAAHALVRLAESRTLREQMGAAARAHFEARFTETAVTDRVRELYRTLLARH